MNALKSSLSKICPALSVAVTGHRPDRLTNADLVQLQAEITKILKLISVTAHETVNMPAAIEVYDRQTPVLRLLSPIAEGVDRMVANCAKAEGYVLQCPLPFSSSVYIEDFQKAGSREEFLAFLGNAESVLELGGNADKKDLAYLEVGRMVLHHADIMLAVWDGVEDELSVGTSGIVAKAQQSGLPLLWIDAAAPHKIRFWNLQSESGQWQDFDGQWLRTCLKSLLLPPEKTVNQSAKEGRALPGSTNAKPKRTFLERVYPVFYSWFGKRCLRVNLKDYQQEAEEQWAEITKAAKRHLPEKVCAVLEGEMRGHYVRADSWASYYADRFRGTFILGFALGWLAVLFAVLSGPFGVLPSWFNYFTVLEFFTIISIAILIRQGNNNQTLQSWLDFRLLAERLRQQAFILPIAVRSHGAQPSYETFDDHSHAWIDWFTHALNRAKGIPGVCLDDSYRKAYAGFLAAVVGDQADYHRRNALRNKNIVTLRQICNWIVFSSVLIACVLHLIGHYLWEGDAVSQYSTIAAALLPAFGSALAGIWVQGEFERISKRSEGMAIKLNEIAVKLNVPQTLTMTALTKLAGEAIDIMGSELSDWRVIFRAKPLEMP